MFAALALATSLAVPDASAAPLSPEPVTSITTIHGAADDDGNSVFVSGHSEIRIVPAPSAELAPAELAGLTASITCDLNVEHVHPSSHKSGTINGVATVNCTAPAGSLTLHYSLIRVSPNNTQWGAGSLSNVGESSIQNNRAVPCSEGPGEFQGWAQGEISPPTGYELEGPATHSDYGASLGVACGDDVADDESSSAIVESMTVTFVRSDLVG
jgi:hypothetical protein